MSDKLTIPLDDYFQTSLDVFQMLEKLMRDGLHGELEKLRNVIAVYSEQWQAQDMPHLWSLKDLAVAIYLDNVPKGARPLEAIPALEAPPGVRFNGGKIEKPLDALRALNLLCRRWRTLDVSIFEYARRLEPYVAHVRRVIYPVPFNSEPLQNACGQLAMVFKGEYIFKELLGGPAQLSSRSLKSGQELKNWLERQAMLMRKSQSENPSVRRIYMEPQMLPGEDSAHARTEHGVFAEGYRDIFESQRPAVAVDAVWTRAHEYDNIGAMGILDFNSVNAVLWRACKFDWLGCILHVDLSATTETLLTLPKTRDPWIMILFGKYYIRDPVNTVTYVAEKSYDAIACWFSVFWNTCDSDCTFFDGVNPHDMKNIPSRIPISRSKWVSGELLELENL